MTRPVLRPRLAAALLALLPVTALVAAEVPAVAAPGAPTDPTTGISTVVRDAGTGAPVARACASFVPVDREELTRVQIGEDQHGRSGGCSDEQGRIRAVDVPAGRYHLLVRPADLTRHGWQWVGPGGGTGQRQTAREVRVRAGRVTAVADVRLDPPGSITGVVTDAATGAPVYAADVMVVPFVPHPKYGGHGPTTDADGRYTVTGLGPYDWPLQFAGRGYATRWSGGVADRRQARLIRVRPGQAATADEQLSVGTVVSGSATSAELPAYSQVVAFNAATGDIVGVAEVGADYRMSVLPGQRVKLRCDCRYAPSDWHRDATGFRAATPVRVRSTTITVDFG